MFDPGKKYQTRDGRPARFVGTLSNGETIWVKTNAVLDRETVITRKADGTAKFGPGGGPNDIIPVVVKTSTFQTVWEKGQGMVFIYPTREGALDIAKMMSINNLVGIVERLYEDGVYAGVVFHEIKGE